jgi:hypothetical protein
MGLVKWDLWWTKWRWGRFSLSTSVSPANLHSTNCFTVTLIYHLGLYSRPEVAAVPGDVSPTPLNNNNNHTEKNTYGTKGKIMEKALNCH